MNTTKKLLATLLCTTVLATAGIAGCGKTQQPAQPQQQQPAQQQQQQPQQGQEQQQPQQEQQQDGAGMANPMVEQESLDKVNELSGGNMMHPAVMGVTNEAFYTIDMGDYVIGEYDFDVNGRPFTFRTATTQQDISGLHMDGKTAFEDFDENDAVVYTSEWYAARWFVGDQQYVLNCVNGAGLDPMDEEAFSSIADEMESMTKPQPAEGEAQPE